MNKYTYTEHFELDAVQENLMLEIDKVGGRIHQGFTKFDYIYKHGNKPTFDSLLQLKLLYDCDDNYYYAIYVFTKRGKQILQQIKQLVPPQTIPTQQSTDPEV